MVQVGRQAGRKNILNIFKHRKTNITLVYLLTPKILEHKHINTTPELRTESEKKKKIPQRKTYHRELWASLASA